jgi:hypothetical protein
MDICSVKQRNQRSKLERQDYMILMLIFQRFLIPMRIAGQSSRPNVFNGWIFRNDTIVSLTML